MFNKKEYAEKWIEDMKENGELHSVALEALASERNPEIRKFLTCIENETFYEYFDSRVELLYYYGFTPCEVDIIIQLAGF